MKIYLILITCVMTGFMIVHNASACDQTCKDFIIEVMNDFDNFESLIKESNFYHPEYTYLLKDEYEKNIQRKEILTYVNTLKHNRFKLFKSRNFNWNLSNLDTREILVTEVCGVFGQTGYGVSFFFGLIDNARYLLFIDMYAIEEEFAPEVRQAKEKLLLKILEQPEEIVKIVKNSDFICEEISYLREFNDSITIKNIIEAKNKGLSFAIDRFYFFRADSTSSGKNFHHSMIYMSNDKQIGVEITFILFEGKWCFCDIYVIDKDQYWLKFRTAPEIKPTYFDIFYFEE